MFIRKIVIIAGIIIGAVVTSGVVMVSVIQPKSKSVLPIKSYNNSDIKIITYKGNHGWGYDIYMDGKLLIHQPHIPALSGNNGFITKAQAQKTAELTVDKIRKHILPPNLTIKELKDIGVTVE